MPKRARVRENLSDEEQTQIISDNKHIDTEIYCNYNVLLRFAR
jgi:hypothetical protein